MRKDGEKSMTKAIILCGGEGKRLRPLTACTPKPLLGVGGVSVIKNIIRLLSRHGIREAAITLGYRGDMIREELGEAFLGVELTYFEEKEPLGSAGGVKKASNFITGNDFLVICGDAWCDFDLTAAYSYFKKTNCDALILTDRKPSSPLEYGLVIAEEERGGRVTSFVEKPSWSGVCSSRVNTGIYILKRSVLDLIPEGKSDFGFDLFTKMPESGGSVYCYDIDGSWQDIGTLEDYYNCNMIATAGENSIGSDCQISSSSHVEKSVIHDCVMIGGCCHISGAVIGTGSVLGEMVKLEEGSVIGPYCVLGDGCVIGRGVAISEGQVIKSREILQNPLYKKDIFTEKGIKLSKDNELENALYCLGVVLGRIYSEKNVGVMYGNGIEEAANARILMLGLSSTDASVTDLGKGFGTLCAYTASKERLDLGVYLRKSDGGVLLGFYDKYGAYPGAAFESLVKHSAVSISTHNFPKRHPVKIQNGIREKYMKSLMDTLEYDLSGISFTFYTEGAFSETVRECIKIMGGREESSGGDFIISGKAESEYIDVIYDGIFFDFDHMRAVCIMIYSQNGIKEISLPYRTGEGLKELVRKSGVRLSLYSETAYDPRENARRVNISAVPALYDGGAALMMFINYVLKNRIRGRELMDRLPDFSTRSKRIFVPENQKRQVAYCGEHYDKEGFVLGDNRGKVRIIPENGDLMCLCAEAGTIEDAAELIKMAEEYVNKFQNSEKSE